MLTTAKIESLVNLKQQPPQTKRLSSAESQIDRSEVQGYQTLHQNPWYLRLKVDRLVDDGEYAQRLLGLVTAIAGVSGVRINPAAKSIAVEFAPDWVNFQLP